VAAIPHLSTQEALVQDAFNSKEEYVPSHVPYLHYSLTPTFSRNAFVISSHCIQHNASSSSSSSILQTLFHCMQHTSFLHLHFNEILEKLSTRLQCLII